MYKLVKGQSESYENHDNVSVLESKGKDRIKRCEDGQPYQMSQKS